MANDSPSLIVNALRVKNGLYVFTFEADDELTYPEGTQISIWQDDTSIPGHIVGCEDFTVIIASSSDLGVDVPTLEFSAEPWKLLNSLVDRLDGILIIHQRLFEY